MMDFVKMRPQEKRNRRRILKNVLVMILCVAPMVFSMQYAFVYAAENTAPIISIEKPDGWKQGPTEVAIFVDPSQMEGEFTVEKIEAKAGNDSGWQDVTSSRSITINRNQTVYVRVTGSDGTVYEQNRSIRCYDTEKPTLSASLTDGVLTIQGNDSVSGLAAITVNGANYTELQDDSLKIQLTQKDFTTKLIEITATDRAGNISDKYTLKNPYYEWAVRQAQQNAASQDMNTATTSQTGETTTSPLPQDAQASAPTDAKGTVDERVVTGIEEELAQSGETAENITQTAANGTKEFYTISTKSGKIFYLVIDNSKSQDNVYFLTEVSEKDLMNFTLSDTVTLPEVDTVYAEPETEEPEPTEEPVTKEPETEEVQMPEDKSPVGSYLLIALMAAGILVVGYYIKIYKPKQEDMDEDEYEEEEAGDEITEPDDAETEKTDSEDVLEDEEE